MDIRPERGNMEEVFAGGRSYQPPSPRPGGSGPHQEEPGPPAWMEPPAVERVGAEPDIKAMVQAMLPKNFLDLDRGTGRFFGYDIRLTPAARAAISEILGEEVIQGLEAEKQLVRTAMRLGQLPPAPSPERPNVPPLPDTPAEVGPQMARPALLRVRKPRATRRPANVPLVPSPEDSSETAGPDT